ncbi:MAG TPA: rhodanese-like domain-containing protein [Planctomycetaceae bacterium]|mgnify:CR=1 FL=1|nr:rhodanese-like domain-containing protein [Planctomycetaceae bacterium]HQZ67786.1 rhodanese-like domain-containing protein [Planctomycetaceae bacterium]
MAKSHGERFVQIVNTVRPQISECTVADVVARQKRGEQFIVVDVREESEFNAARIPGAVHIGKGVIERDIEEKIPDTAAPMVLYCGGGYRSALAALNLKQMGYTDVMSMDGGFRGWKEAGLEIDATPGDSPGS